MAFSHLVLLFCLLALAYGAGPNMNNPRFKQIHSECQSDPATRLDKEIMQKLNTHEPGVDMSQLGPHILCLNVKRGMQKENGDVDQEGLRKEFEPLVTADVLEAIVRECGPIRANGKTPAEMAMVLAGCIKRNTH